MNYLTRVHWQGTSESHQLSTRMYLFIMSMSLIQLFNGTLPIRILMLDRDKYLLIIENDSGRMTALYSSREKISIIISWNAPLHSEDWCKIITFYLLSLFVFQLCFTTGCLVFCSVLIWNSHAEKICLENCRL